MIRDLLLSAVAPRPRRANVDARGIALYGDSIMNAGIARHLAALIPDAWILDRSLPGDTAQNAWRRMPYEVCLSTWAVLSVGTNDVSAGRDPLPYLERMVDLVQAEGRLPILTGLTRRADGLHEPTNARIAALAALRLLPWAGWASIPLDSPDGLHPSDLMARQLALELRGAIPWR